MYCIRALPVPMNQGLFTFLNFRGTRHRMVCERLSIYSFQLSDARVWEQMFI